MTKTQACRKLSYVDSTTNTSPAYPNLNVQFPSKSKHHWNEFALISAIFLSLSALLMSIVWTWPYVFSISDTIAQFMPISIEGYRSIKAGDLPLFNYFQYMGYPLSGVGYYPVLYPIFLFAAAISDLTGDLSRAFDITYSIQLILNGAVTAFFCLRILRMSTPLALSCGLSVEYMGITLHLMDWVHVPVAIGFTLILMCLIFQCMKLPSWHYGVLLGTASAIFLFSSNVNFIFYSAHFLAMFTLLLWLLERGNVGLKHIKAFFVSGFAFFLFSAGWLLDFILYLPNSNRDTDKVTLDKYYWTYLNPNHLWTDLWRISWTDTGRQFWQAPYVYHIGPIATLGLLLSLPILLLLYKRKQNFDALMLTYFAISTILAGLLMVGPHGLIGGWLYHVPIYNWFRHSIKWAPFFGLFACLTGFFALDRLFKSYFKPKLLLIFGILLISVTTLELGVFIRNMNPQLRFTETVLPLPKPILAVNTMYRHIGLWHGSQETLLDRLYKTDTSGRIIGHDLSSYWRLPTLAGYDPMVVKENLEIAQGNWDSGFYLNAQQIKLDEMAEYGVRWIRVPTSTTNEVLDILRTRYPKLSINLFGHDTSLNCDVLEVEPSLPLVFSSDPNTVIDSLDIRGRSVFTHVTTTSQKSELSLNWLWNPHFRIFAGGQELAISKDIKKRITAKLDKKFDGSIELRYEPTIVVWSYRIGWMIGLPILMLACISLWQDRRKLYQV